MELHRITRQIHCKAVEQRATLIHRQYNRDWGTSYSRPTIDPHLTSPLLQNPGGATAKVCRKITINDEMNLFFKLQSLFGTFIHTYIQIYTAPKIVRTNLSFLRVLFDKISSVHCVCILWATKMIDNWLIDLKKNIFRSLEMASPGTSTVPIVSAHFRCIFDSVCPTFTRRHVCYWSAHERARCYVVPPKSLTCTHLCLASVQYVCDCRVYTGWSDVTKSMVTIRSPFCGYNMA